MTASSPLSTKVPLAPPRPKAPVISLNSNRNREESKPPSSGFAAVIEGASLADLVQLECMRGLTRSVRVQAEEKQGVLFFDQGELVHAETDQLQGEEAALFILSWETGSVKPSDKIWVSDASIQISWQGLLMKAAQYKDELARSPMESAMIARSPNQPPQEAPVPEEAMKSNFDSGLIRALRLDSEGEIVESQGEVDDFRDGAAYAVRLAHLIGEGLGLEEFNGMECVSHSKTMIAYVEDDCIVAIEAKSGAKLSHYRKLAGT